MRKFARNDPAHPFPSLSAFGPNMAGADLTFQDYANAPQRMGNLRFMLQNWVDGNLNTPITITVWYVNNPSRRCTVTVTLNADYTWTSGGGQDGCQQAIAAPGIRSTNNTIGIGLPGLPGLPGPPKGR